MQTRGTGRLAVLTVLLALLSTGCTPDPVIPPTPSPVAPSPTPTENPQEREQRLAYEAAEKSYRDFRAEFSALLNKGGAAKPTQQMQDLAGGPYLSEFANIVEAYHETGNFTKGRERVGYVRHAGYEKESLLLDVCEDSRSVVGFNRKQEKLGEGEVRTARLTVRRTGGTWKVWSGEGKKVTSCDA